MPEHWVKSVKLGSLFILLLLVAVACSKGTKTEVDQKPSASVETTNEKGNKEQPKSEVKLTFQNHFPDASSVQHQIMQKLVADYMEHNKHVKIEVDALNIDQQKIKLKTQAASNEMPDITVVNANAQMKPFVDGNKLASLNDILAMDGLKESFHGGILDYYTFDNEVYALPDGNNIAVVYYNKSLFKEAGVEVPSTYEEMVAAAKVFKEKGIIPMTVGEKETWTGSFFFMNIVLRLAGPGYLNEVQNGTKTFMDPAFIESIEKMQEFIQAGGFQEGATSFDYEMAENLFVSGKAAMYFMGTWATGDLEGSELGEDMGVFPFPTIDGKGSPYEFMLGPGTAFALSANSKNLEESKKFLHYYMLNYPKVSFEMKNAVGLAQNVSGDFEQAGYSRLSMDVLEMFKKVEGGDIAFDNTMDPSTTQAHLNSIQNLFVANTTAEDTAKEHQNALEANK